VNFLDADGLAGKDLAEVDFLANRLFWEGENAHTHEADIEYYRRQDRLEAIRRKVVVLTN
jgi:hypothetical protein